MSEFLLPAAHTLNVFFDGSMRASLLIAVSPGIVEMGCRGRGGDGEVFVADAPLPHSCSPDPHTGPRCNKGSDLTNG